MEPKPKEALLEAADPSDPELTRARGSPFTGGDGRPSEPERIQIMVQAAPTPQENLAPTSHSGMAC